MKLEISYKNSLIGSLSAGESLALHLNGSKLTEDLIVRAVGEAVELPSLSAPTIEIADSTLNIYDEEGLATSYDILVDGEVVATVEKPSGYNVTINFEQSTTKDTPQSFFHIFINGEYENNYDDIVYSGTYSSSGKQYDPISLTDVTSIGITNDDAFPTESSFSNSIFEYKIDGISKGEVNGFIPITSDCTVTFIVPLLD